MKKVLLFFFLITTLSSLFGFSSLSNSESDAKGIIRAIIMDAKTNTPLEYANVTVHKSNDSTYVGGSATGKGGELLIPNLPDGEYYVKVSFIGYDKLIIPNVVVSKEKKEISLGLVKISPAEVKVGEVNVVAEKPNEEFHIDKRVINVSKDNTAAGGTALDVLKNHPSIQTDSDGNVLLRGSSNFTVLVNGRPGVLQGSDALRQIAANIIENIELITNPSAKYDAEGAAGIINIVTKAIAQDNLSGIINGGAGSRNKYNGDATVNYKTNGLGFSGTADYRKSSNYSIQSYNRYSIFQNINTHQTANIRQLFGRENYSLKLGVDYTFSPTSGISLSSSYGATDFGGNFILDAIDRQNTQTNIVRYTSNVETLDVTAKYFQSILYFNHQFSPKIDEIIFEAVYTNVSQPQDRIGREYVTDSKHENRSLQPATQQFANDTNREDVRLKLNYSYKFNDKSKLEAGLQTNLAYRNFDFVARNFNWTSNQWVVNSIFTNQFDFRNNIYSAFVTFSNNLELLDIDYQLGLRAEQTDRLLTQNTLGKTFEYNQVHLFPSLNLLKKLSDGQQLQFSYSRRINRPFEFALNPFPNYSDSYAQVIGNPNLLPEMINSFELNYQNTLKSGIFLSAQSYYRNTNNTITQTMLIQDDGRLNLSFGNVAKTYTVGTELSASIPATQWLRLNPAINLFQTGLEGYLLGVKTENDQFTWSTRLQTTVMFSAATRFQMNLFYIGKQATIQGTIDPLVNLNVSLRQEFFDRQLIVTASVQNIFNTGKFKMVSAANKGTNLFLNGYPEAPIFNLTMSFNFNNFKSTSKVNERVDINVNSGF
ncbi:MAG: TonB-dependent receptor [Ignavibacteria bacterium]|nr:TonB-dependent receptor [Ignavibacteria bacterium]